MTIAEVLDVAMWHAYENQQDTCIDDLPSPEDYAPDQISWEIRGPTVEVALFVDLVMADMAKPYTTDQLREAFPAARETFLAQLAQE